MKDIIQRRLEYYATQTAEDELNALKEITQEVALYGLYKSGFFQKACFLGGTSLRILHGVDRFSEDLDFSTFEVMEDFKLEDYLKNAITYMNAYGFEFSIAGEDQETRKVQGRFIKDDSIKKILTFKHTLDPRSKIKIKVEIDTHPPAGAQRKMEYVDFPVDFPVMSYDLPSLFAGKLHALLCRPYNKGRDLFDFLWYVANQVKPNYVMLGHALDQQGPWRTQKNNVDQDWLKKELTHKIKSIEWNSIILDVRKFLKANRREGLELWNQDFFQTKINKINY